MRLGLLGGSFDPVHNGHLALARAALAEAELDSLIVMPARVQPFKQENEVTEARHREEMTRLAFAELPQARVSRYELEQADEISYTVNTLFHLQESNLHEEIFFICGTDSFLSMESWYRGAEILSRFGVIVSARPGYREEELRKMRCRYEELYQTRIVQLAAQMPDISSTDVRERVAAGRTISDLVPPAVERYIRSNGLYRKN